MNPEIRYAKSGDIHIAYQVFGNGPENLVIIPGFISHVEHVWDSPDQAAWFTHLARRARQIRQRYVITKFHDKSCATPVRH